MIHRIFIRYVTYGGRGIVLNKQVSKNLRLQLLCAVLISLVSGLTVFGIVFLLGNTLLDQTVYGHSFAKKMAKQQFLKLQNYVKEENISLDNLQRLNVWCSRGEKVYLTIYKDGIVIFESRTGEQNDSLNTQEFDSSIEDPEDEYILTLQGNINVQAFLYYYAGDIFYFGMIVMSGLLAFVVFSLCFVMLINRKVSYISLLRKELEILSGGQLEYQVTINGNDEIGELAAGIDQMRRSIMKHQEVEQQMRSANSELITAMSHDLRTPLTSLLAYLEIIERKKYVDEEQMYSLIHKSIGQTMRIKNMADKLFEYFLAYATEWEEAEMEFVDADMLLEQILGEYVYALESRGFHVVTDFSQVNSQISVNLELFQRALDNLYSNLIKYADLKEGIKISYKREEKNVLIDISNKICIEKIKNDSAGIGLTTCRKIIVYHKGYCKTIESNDYFIVNIKIPLQEKKEL